MKHTQTEQEFTTNVRNDFENSLHDIDADVAVRLAASRARALAGRTSPYRAWIQVPVAALLVTCLAIASYNILLPSVPVQSYSPDDIELLTTLDSLDLYDDEEFYEWLDEQEFSAVRRPING